MGRKGKKEYISTTISNTNDEGGPLKTQLSRIRLSYSPPHISHMVLPSKPSDRSDCCWRARKMLSGRTHMRWSPARAPRPHMPSSQATRVCVSPRFCPQAPSHQKTGENTISCRWPKQPRTGNCLCDWLTGCKKKNNLWTSLLFRWVARSTTQATKGSNCLSAADGQRSCLVG